MSTETFTSADIETAATGAVPAASAPADPGSSSSAAPATSAPDPDLTDPAWGTIPPDRRQPIMDNLRKRAAADYESKLASAKQEWAASHWAKDIDPQEAAIVREWVARGRTDPASLVLDLYQRVQNDPTHGARLRSEAARILGGHRQPQQDPEPGPDIPTDASNGRPVVYSAEAQARREAWLKRQWMAEVKQEFAPLQEDLQSRQQTAQVQALQAQANDYAASTVAVLEKQPGFADHKAEIARVYAAMELNDPRSEGEKLRDAYFQVVVPQLSASGRQQAVADLHRKANASTVNPSQTARTEPYDHRKNLSEKGWAESFEVIARQKGLIT